jgi:AcrR family transcriptional regulator
MSSNELQQAPRWQRRPEDRPDEILDAATTVFGEQGFARTRLEDVAKRAGVSKGTLYLYFDSKDALFREMVRRNVVSAIAEAEAKYLDHPGSAREALTALVHAWWEKLGNRESACIHRLVGAELSSFPELGRFYFEEVVSRSRRLIGALIARGIADGEFRPVVNEYAIRGLPSLVFHAINTQRFYATFDPAALDDTQVIDGILDLFFHGVLAAPAAATESR